jgi:hypothetical protein
VEVAEKDDAKGVTNDCAAVVLVVGVGVVVPDSSHRNMNAWNWDDTTCE